MKLKELLIMGVGIAIVGSIVSVAGISYASTNKKNNDQSKIELITSDKAKSIMTAKVPGGNIVEFSYDASSVEAPKYDGVLIKDNVEYEVDVNAKTGEVIKFEEKNIAITRENKEAEEKAAQEAAAQKAAEEAAAQKAAEEAAAQKAAQEAAAQQAAQQQAAQQQAAQQQANSSVTTNTQQQGASTSGLISAEKAKSIMLSQVPGGTLIKFEFDYDHTPEYEGEIISGDWEYDITVDARTGNIIEFEKESRWDD